MTKEEFLDLHYPDLKWIDLSDSCKMIQSALWDAYDEKSDIVNIRKFEFAYKKCVPLYNKLKKYEAQIKKDLEEYNGVHGTPMFSIETLEAISVLIQDMAFICDIYHKNFEVVDISLLKEDNKNDVTAECDENLISSKEVNYKDEDPEHRKWFIKILDSKIPNRQKDKDEIIYECLSHLYDELCNLGCFDSNNEEKSIFIYRFSGLNGRYPEERKILWKGKNVFLGYIVRCLISDNNNGPVNQGTVASYFQSKSGNPINLSVETRPINDYEKEKGSLHPDLVKAVELLRKCRFVNVEHISSRR